MTYNETIDEEFDEEQVSEALRWEWETAEDTRRATVIHGAMAEHDGSFSESDNLLTILTHDH